MFDKKSFSSNISCFLFVSLFVVFSFIFFCYFYVLAYKVEINLNKKMGQFLDFTANSRTKYLILEKINFFFYLSLHIFIRLSHHKIVFYCFIVGRKKEIKYKKENNNNLKKKLNKKQTHFQKSYYLIGLK